MASKEIPMFRVWLIPGSSRGLGRALAEAVLAAGHKLVATARNPEQLADLVERYGDQVRTVALDVTNEQEIETNLFGVINVTKAALPLMREQGAGHILQFSSVGGRIAPVGRAPYAAAK